MKVHGVAYIVGLVALMACGGKTAAKAGDAGATVDVTSIYKDAKSPYVTVDALPDGYHIVYPPDGHPYMTEDALPDGYQVIYPPDGHPYVTIDASSADHWVEDARVVPPAPDGSGCNQACMAACPTGDAPCIIACGC
jgi:hypothetical protein